MKVSIIIPVYNVAEYLAKCIDSCLQQDLPDGQWEIILIDDGSTDDSGRICREYADRHQYVAALSQENQGQSVARNRGLNKAQGEYIWFVDADDWIAAKALQKISDLADHQQLDMLDFSGIEYHDQGQPQPITNNRIAENEMAGRDFLLANIPTTCTPLYLFRRSFLLENQIEFLPGVFHEDEDFIFRSLYLCRKVGFIDDFLYYVYARQDSTTRSINPHKAYDLLAVAGSLSRFVENTVAKPYQPVFHTRIALLLNEALANSLNMNEHEIVRLNQAFHGRRQLFRHLRKSPGHKEKIEGWLLTMFPRHSVQVFQRTHRC